MMGLLKILSQSMVGSIFTSLPSTPFPANMRSQLWAIFTSVLVLTNSAVAGLNADIAPLVARTWNGTQYACKTYYDDPVWQNPNMIKSLNNSVNGNLQLVIPPGASCHHTFQGPLGNISNYNAAKCAEETANFANEQWT
jgi:hypothetical protein